MEPKNVSIESQFISSKVITLNHGEFPVRGIRFNVPVGVFMQKMISDKLLIETSSELASNEITTDVIAAHDYDGLVIASEICKQKGKKLLWLQRNMITGKISGLEQPETSKAVKLFNREKVTVITGVLATGNHSADAIALLEENGGKCEKVISIFDYGFHLQPSMFQKPSEFEVIKRVPIDVYSLITLQSIFKECNKEENQILAQWFKLHSKNLFRDVKKITEPWSAKISEPAN